ncbi:hypothetical protein DW107_08015, partial [Tannerella sp. AM09-19]
LERKGRREKIVSLFLSPPSDASCPDRGYDILILSEKMIFEESLSLYVFLRVYIAAFFFIYSSINM